MARQGSLSAELSKCENIELLEQINHSELMDLMAGAKAVILPSQVYEGFPMIILEAFWICAPMIVGDIENSSVLIKDGYNGIEFKYDSAKSMIDAIDRLEEADQGLLRNNTYNDYKAQYFSGNNYERLIGIYRSVQL